MSEIFIPGNNITVPNINGIPANTLAIRNPELRRVVRSSCLLARPLLARPGRREHTTIRTAAAKKI